METRIEPAPQPSARRRTLLHVCFGALLGAAVIAGGSGISAALAPEKEKPAIEYERREIPKEWRYELPGVKYKHMYYKR